MKGLKKNLRNFMTIFAISVCLLVLSGCGNIDTKVELNKDGSGFYSMNIGVPERVLKKLDSSESEVLKGFELSKNDTFNVNGDKCYGGYITTSFDSVKELNKVLKQKNFKFTPDLRVYDFIRFEEKGNSKYVLWVNIDNIYDVFSDKSYFYEFGSEVGFSEQDIDILYKMKKELYVDFELKLEKEINVIDSTVDCIDISGKSINIDIVKMVDRMRNNSELALVIDMSSDDKFTVEQYVDDEIDLIDLPIIFDDVRPKAWYYNAVRKVAEQGIITGSEGKFNPESELSYAQFCQIILNHGLLNSDTTQADLDKIMMDMGRHNGYWAYSAIDFGLESNLIPYIGDIVPENYDKPIPREVAISSFYQLYLKNTLDGKTPPNANPIIPDFDSISDIYKENIKAMYQWGVIKGYDDGSFNPLGTLSRGEMCQIFANVLDE